MIGPLTGPNAPVSGSLQRGCNLAGRCCVCEGVVAEATVSEQEIDPGPDFDDFIASEFTNVLALAIAALGNRDDALDIAQETMARTFDRWDEVATMGRPGAWARRVALNLVADALRRRTRRHRMDARLRAQRAPVADDPMVDGWDRKFWTEVAALPERQRSVVLLHYVEDLSVADIASVLDVPDGTVKSDLSRSRARLRDAMEGSES